MTVLTMPSAPNGMHIRVNLIANFAGQGWSALISLVFVPVYIQLLGIESFALIGFYAMLQLWLTLLDFGIMPTTAREMARFTSGATAVEPIRDLLRSFELICFAVALLVAVALATAADWIATQWLNAEHLPSSTVASAIALMGVVVATRFGESLYRSCLIGLQRQVWLNAASAASATLRNVGAVLILLWIDRSITAYFLWNVAISVGALVVLGLKVHRLLPRPSRPARFCREALASVGRFAAGIFGINVLGLMLIQSDKLILSRLLPLETYGYYMLAATIAGALYTISLPITQAVYPAMIEHVSADRPSDLARIYHRAAQLVTAIVAPATLILVFFAKPFLFAWSGDMALAEASAPLLRLLAAGTLINILLQMPYYLQLAHGWTRLAFWANLVAVLALVPALIWLVPIYGAPAAAGLWLAMNVAYLIVVVPLMFRRLLRREMWHWLARDVGSPIAAAFVVLAAASYVPLNSQSRIVQGLFLAIAGAMSLCFALATVWRWGPRSLLLLQRGQ